MHFPRWIFLGCLLLSPLALWAQREKLPPEDLEIVQKQWPEAVRSANGLRSLVLKPGEGPQVKSGDRVSVLYKGQLLDGRIFDQTTGPDRPLKFRVGRSEVIEGWDEGLRLMRVGEKRLLIIPFELGYGTRGNPPKIPRRATLVFEVEVLSIDP